ncbi:MAG: short-chain dehydrogenase [Anaerolinea sp.]|jgi:glucose 1-dehydrogenase/3-oxoacyl-[acyl-carrier protein] reductase|nr:short-chain dehydrogenase [Anaerolinea sp.]
MTERRHQGRVALVTGAGAGIGRAIATRLADEGCALVCTDVRCDAAAETAAQINRASGQAIAFEADVRDRRQIETALAGAIEAFGRLNYLVNNAGLVTMHRLEDLDDEAWDLVVDVNLKGQFVVTQLAATHLRQAAPAAVVNLSTIESEVVVATTGHCQPHYNASKGGVRMLTKALAVELAADGIRVNAVAPGPVQTGFVPGVDPTDPRVPPAVLDRLLIRRLGQPSEIAAAVSFLLSDDASYITGTQLVVDGGWLTR